MSTRPPDSPVACYAIFHLNLAFSSIAVSQHAEVIRRCYWPLLSLVRDHHLPLGFEITGYTLEQIQRLDSAWVDEFRRLLKGGCCELIGSGDTQLIGPLVPAMVNHWNTRLGLSTYKRLLGVSPDLAYINEQALSASLLDVLRDEGVKGVVTEWDNPRMVHPEWEESVLHTPVNARTAGGSAMPVLWNWSIAFQKFQRLAHGDLVEEDYLRFVADEVRSGIQAVAVYGSDAEVFDFRPGRFREEVVAQAGEWQRIEHALVALGEFYRWSRPSDVLKGHLRTDRMFELTTSEHPVVVKKQRKYNLTRWAVTGRNDLALNTLCFNTFDALAERDEAEVSDDERRALCRLWASDYRTHLDQERYDTLKPVLDRFSRACSQAPVYWPDRMTVEPDPISGWSWQWDERRKLLHISNPTVDVTLNMRRGGALKSLSWGQNPPVLGTLEHGAFRNIELGADFYTCHTLIELPGQRTRITDLDPVAWSLTRSREVEGALEVYCELKTVLGNLRKRFRLHPTGQLDCSWFFPNWTRPEGVVRVGWLTFQNRLADAVVRLGTHHGGHEPEWGVVRENVAHGESVSQLVSASSALGGTAGVVYLATGDAGVGVTWEPGRCAALPMLHNKVIGKERLTRLYFSLTEVDETLRAGGSLLPFTLTLRPWQPNAPGRLAKTLT